MNKLLGGAFILNTVFFLFKRLIVKSERTFSKLIVRIAILGIALGLAVMLLTVAVVNGFQKTIPNQLIGLWGHVQIGKLDLNSNTLDTPPIEANDSLLRTLQTYPNIRHIQSFATKAGVAKTDGAFEGIVLKGVGKDYDWSVLKKNLLLGTIPSYSDTTPAKEVLIPKNLADRLQMKLGDKLPVYFIQQPPRLRAFVVAGIYNTGVESELGKPFIIADIRHIQRLNAWQDTQIGGYEVFLKDLKLLKPSSEWIREQVDVDVDAKNIEELFPQLFSWLALFNINQRLILIVMVLVAGINMVSALLILILERTSMIGLLKTLGMSNWNIRKLFLLIGAYLIGFGMLIGNIFGILLVFLQSKIGLFKLPEESYYVSKVPVSIEWWHIVFINGLTLVACFSLLILPSFLITKISPIKAIRFK